MYSSGQSFSNVQSANTIILKSEQRRYLSFSFSWVRCIFLWSLTTKRVVARIMSLGKHERLCPQVLGLCKRVLHLPPDPTSEGWVLLFSRCPGLSLSERTGCHRIAGAGFSPHRQWRWCEQIWQVARDCLGRACCASAPQLPSLQHSCCWQARGGAMLMH